MCSEALRFKNVSDNILDGILVEELDLLSMPEALEGKKETGI